MFWKTLETLIGCKGTTTRLPRVDISEATKGMAPRGLGMITHEKSALPIQLPSPSSLLVFS